MRKMVVSLGILVLILTGCGSHNSHEIVKPVENNLPGEVIVLKPNATVATEQSAGTFTVVYTKEAFPDGAQVGVLELPNLDRPENPDLFVSELPAISLAANCRPSSDIFLKLPSGKSSRGLASSIATFLVKRLSNGMLTTVGYLDPLLDRIRISPDKFTEDGGIFEVGGYVVSYSMTALEEEFGLEQYGAEDSTTRYDVTLFLVHGINSSADSLYNVAKYCASTHFYRRIFLFKYPYTKDSAAAAQALAGYVRNYLGSGYVKLIAHSRGTIVCDYMLKNVLTYEESKNILSYTGICGPHQGCRLATVSKIVFSLWDEFINRRGGSPNKYGLANFDSPAVYELLPNSDFIRTLGDYDNVARPYQLSEYQVGGSADLVVDWQSAIADDQKIEAFARGDIFRHVFSGATHTSLIDSDEGVAELFQYLDKPRYYRNLIFGFSDRFLFNNEKNNWYVYSFYDNQESFPIAIADALLDDYDASGNWHACYWFAPNTSKRWQKEHYYVYYWITPGETYYADFYIWPNDNSGYGIDPLLARRTIGVSCRFVFEDGIISDGMVLCSLADRFEIMPDNPMFSVRSRSHITRDRAPRR